MQGWIRRTPVNTIQAQAVKPTDEEIGKQLQMALKDLPLDIRMAIWEHGKRNKTQPNSESAGSK
jgi:hypothetical protein